MCGLGCSLFAHHYLGNHNCFLFLRLLRCFSSPGLPPDDKRQDTMSSTWWVSPFGNLRIKGYLHLPEAYRSLSRPSSPLRAKAFTIRSYLLSLHWVIQFYLMNFLPIRQRTYSRKTGLRLHPESNQILYHNNQTNKRTHLDSHPHLLVENIGVEPMTSWMQIKCSSQLS